MEMSWNFVACAIKRLNASSPSPPILVIAVCNNLALDSASRNDLTDAEPNLIIDSTPNAATNTAPNLKNCSRATADTEFSFAVSRQRGDVCF